MSSSISHQIATDAAKLIVRKGMDAGLSWEDLSVAVETTLTIVVVACATMSRTPRQEDFIREIIETVTERAHTRAMEFIRGEQQP